MNKFYTGIFTHNNELYERGYENGKAFFRKRANFKPKLYTCSINSNTPIRCITEPDLTLQEHVFESVKEMKNFVYNNNNKTIYGNKNPASQYITDEYRDGITYDKGLIRKMFFDIETTAENGFPSMNTFSDEVTLITCGYNRNECVTFSAYRQYTGDNKNVDYRYFDTEEEMLKNFIVWFENENPDCFAGYYSDKFDIPYLFGRIKKILNKTWLSRLSPVKHIVERKSNELTIDRDENGNQAPTEIIYYKITGIQTLDYMDIYKKFHFGEVTSYKLDNIAESEIGWRKIQNPSDTFKEFYNGEAEFKTIPDSFKDLECVQLSHQRYLAKEKYGKDSNEYYILDAKTKQSFWNLFVEYNVRDVELLIELENKLEYLSLLITVAYMQFANYEDVMGTIAQWHSRLDYELKKRGFVWENPKEQSRKEQFEGGFVKEVKKGLHGWVLSFDYTSLYPSIMRALGISPETYRGTIDVDFYDLLEKKVDLSALKRDNFAIGANGALYDNSIDGFLPQIIAEIFNQRKEENGMKKTYSKQIESLIKTLPDGININEFNLDELHQMLTKGC